jgi:hypothetical protein
MHALELKIPPVTLVMGVAFLMWLAAAYAPGLNDTPFSVGRRLGDRLVGDHIAGFFRYFRIVHVIRGTTFGFDLRFCRFANNTFV